jgi:hypothetical protein
LEWVGFVRSEPVDGLAPSFVHFSTGSRRTEWKSPEETGKTENHPLKTRMNPI